MNIAQIENNIQQLLKSFNKESFIYDLLAAYYLPKASISRLQKGNLNMSKVPGEVSWKKKLFFKEELKKDLHLTISNLKDELKHNQRFVIVTDYKTLLAIDTQTQDKMDIPFKDLAKHYDFFLPWAGMEKATHAAENPADVKAAEKMAKLFDEIKKDNPDTSTDFIHSLNIFFSRILFCFFAEDTNIYEDHQFTYAIQSHTRADGSDLDAYLNRLFIVLNTSEEKRSDLPQYLNDFPYVNGGLFKEKIQCPKFSAKSRQLLIDSGDSNDWSAINPDIFGSMFQAVISPEHRGGLGAHYTSVPNIMKVIEPLFLNDLKEAFEEADSNKKKLKELLIRLSKIKLFDPACGSGNFLIIAYKELRRLEMQILKKLGEVAFSGIHLNNFYGIEIDDFAHEIAKLSLWLAEHQMNVEFYNEFGRTSPTLPLQEAGQIACGNACRLDWKEVCPKKEGDEIYIMGNPPYLGFNERNKDQKADMDIALNGITNIQRLDYIGCWFIKASEFINKSNSKYSFVSTNSICQGEQVSLLWPYIFTKGQNIFFAYKPFKWTNNAKGNAGVTCVILGVMNSGGFKKIIYSDERKKNVNKISPYLIEGNSVIISQRNTPISNLPEMILGSSGIDGGHLLLTKDEKDAFINMDIRSNKFIKQFIGGGDFIDGKERYCLWIEDEDVEDATKIEIINDRVQKCKKFRLSAGRDAKKAASVPHRFFYRKHQDKDAIIIPMTSSEKREYLPVGFLTNRSIVSNGVLVIYDAQTYILSLISSKIHMLWALAVSGKLESRIRYSVNLVYNCFPFPIISSQRKEELTQCTFRILEEREKHPEKTLADLYDPDKMPKGLREAHRLNDEAVERCYRSSPFTSDEERLEYLFKLYEKMIQEEQEKGTLFEMEKKTRKKK